MPVLIYYFVIYFVEMFIWEKYVSIVFSQKGKRKKRLFALAAIYLCLFVISQMKIVWLNNACFVLGNFIYIMIFCDIKWYIALLHTATITAVMALSELSTLQIVFPYGSDSASFASYIIWAVLSKAVYFILVLILACIFKKKVNGVKSYEQTSLLLIIIPAVSILIMVILYSVGRNCDLDSKYEWLLSMASTLLLLVNILMFAIYSYNQRKNDEFIEMQILLQKEHDFSEYYKLLLNQTETQNILVHDIKKHLQTVSILGEQQEYQKMNAYIQKLTKAPVLQTVARICDNEMLNMLLYRYRQQCLDMGIGFHVDIRKETLYFVEDMDLTSLFCNLLDNAFEAVKKTTDGYIDLNVTKHETAAITIISMINSCQDSPYTKDTQRLVSHKKDHYQHGYGMKSIAKTAQKYHGDLQTYYDAGHKEFHTIVTLKQL